MVTIILLLFDFLVVFYSQTMGSLTFMGSFGILKGKCFENDLWSVDAQNTKARALTVKSFLIASVV